MKMVTLDYLICTLVIEFNLGKVITTIQGHAGGVSALSISSDGTVLESGGI